MSAQHTSERDLHNGTCECGERCSCPPGSEARARCSCWNAADTVPVKVWGLLMMHPDQKPLIEKHCFGDCGQVSMAGVINDDQLGGLWVCPQATCPWLGKEMDEPYGTTMSFGRPHEVFLRVISDTPSLAKATGGAA